MEEINAGLILAAIISTVDGKELHIPVEAYNEVDLNSVVEISLSEDNSTFIFKLVSGDEIE